MYIFDMRYDMPGNFEKEDLRIKKTYRALTGSMSTLLNRRNFEKITVNDLCDEALISRVTFYTHFNDKYDLLKYWLDNMGKDLIDDVGNSGEIILTINQIINDNSKRIKNLVENANGEVSELLHNFMYSFVDIAINKKDNNGLNYNQILLSNFCAGGIVSLLKLQVKNRFSPESRMVNAYFLKMLESLIEWDSKQTEE